MVNQQTSISIGDINSNGGDISIGNQQYITNIFHSSEWKKMEEDKEKLEKNIQLFESLLLKYFLISSISFFFNSLLKLTDIG